MRAPPLLPIPTHTSPEKSQTKSNVRVKGADPNLFPPITSVSLFPSAGHLFPNPLPVAAQINQGEGARRMRSRKQFCLQGTGWKTTWRYPEVPRGRGVPDQRGARTIAVCAHKAVGAMRGCAHSLEQGGFLTWRGEQRREGAGPPRQTGVRGTSRQGGHAAGASGQPSSPRMQAGVLTPPSLPLWKAGIHTGLSPAGLGSFCIRFCKHALLHIR